MRALVLPATAVVLVAAVLGIQLAAGGADYGPRQPADPCHPRPIPAALSGLDPLLEEIVLLGLDNAACRLGISRERLVLSLATPQTMDPAAPAALKAGLRSAVDRLERAGRLPKVSKLLPDAVQRANLPGIVEDRDRPRPGQRHRQHAADRPAAASDDRQARRERAAPRAQGPEPAAIVRRVGAPERSPG